MTQIELTREQWLQKGALLLERDVFKQAGYEVPNVHISIGFCSTGRKSNRIGECWSSNASSDGKSHIYIEPGQEKSSRILDILAHELVHAVVGCENGHNKVFKRCALAIGLTGKMTATVAGERLSENISNIIDEIGEIPHSKLNYALKPKKKQTTRNLKTFCEPCDYKCRVSRTTLDKYGAPICPSCGVQMESV